MSNAELGAWDGRFDDEVRIGYSLEPLPSPRLIEGQESEETEYGTPIDDDMTIEIEDIEENEESGETNVAHRVDYMLAAGCGIISGAIDSLWVGKFDFDRAREWGSERVNEFVMAVLIVWITCLLPAVESSLALLTHCGWGSLISIALANGEASVSMSL